MGLIPDNLLTVELRDQLCPIQIEETTIAFCFETNN